MVSVHALVQVGKLSGADDASAGAVLSELRSTSTDEMVLRDLEQALTDLEIWDPVPSFRRCVKWALDRFHELYDVNIRALLKVRALSATPPPPPPSCLHACLLPLR